MHIVLAAEGTRGDVHPMLALGASLRRAGHAVRICAPPDFAEAARAHGLEHRAVGGSVRAYLTRHAGALHGGGFGVLRESFRYGREALASQFAALPDAVRGADLVIGAGVQLAAPSAAERHGARYRYVAYCPALLPSAEHAPAFLPLRTRTPALHRAAWAGMRTAWNLGFRRVLDRHRAALGLPALRGDLLAHLLGSRPLLAADRALAPAPRNLPFPVEQVPCLHPADGDDPLPAKLEAFLAGGPPAVYLGFGSMTDPHPAATTARLLEAIASLGCRAVLGRGWAGLGEGPLPEGVMAVGSVCHARLFPRVAAVVHHGGAGTTTTAARAGTPQLLLPHLLDQFYWAKRVEELGLGPPGLPRRRATPRALAEALGHVLENEVMAERAGELAARLRAERLDEAEIARRVTAAQPEAGPT